MFWLRSLRYVNIRLIPLNYTKIQNIFQLNECIRIPADVSGHLTVAILNALAVCQQTEISRPSAKTAQNKQYTGAA